MTLTTARTHPAPPGTVAHLATLSPTKVAELIGIPLDRWPGNCHGIAMAIVDAGLVPAGSRAVYGHWRGTIAETSIFAPRRALGFTGHGWILTREEQIIDPTRWVFEDVDAYIYIGADPEGSDELVCRSCEHLAEEHADMFGGRCDGGDMVGYDCGPCLFDPSIDARALAERDEYDEGGNQLRAATLRPYPVATSAEIRSTAPPAPTAAVLAQFGYGGGGLSIAQLLWLANLPLEMLEGTAATTYQWLIDEGFSALIPHDNRVRVLG